MTALRTLILLLAAAALAKAQVPVFGWCPDHLAKTDFDIDKFLGTWYEVERYVSIMEAANRCVRTEYTRAKDNRILVANEITNRLTGIKRILNGEIRSVPKGSEPKLNVKYSTLPYPVETSYTVLDTDYDDYAVLWSCSGIGIFNSQNAWVMSRTQNPSVTTLQKAYAVLDKFKIGRTFFVKSDQTDCAIAEPADNDVEKEEEDGAAEKAAAVVPEEGAEAVAAPAAEAVAAPAAEAKPDKVVEDVVRKETPSSEIETKPEAEKEHPVNEVEPVAKPAVKA